MGLAVSSQIFIDGQEGTTGLQIYSRLNSRNDIELIQIESKFRKNKDHRARCYEQADLIILCLPDAASEAAVQDLLRPESRILDASSAFRTHPDWTYGLPELGPHQSKLISNSSHVSNPGCYATGYILLIRPLIAAGLIGKEICLSVQGISGYSGGGRKCIEQWQGSDQPTQAYGLDLKHKHLPEMRMYSGCQSTPLFSPFIANYAAGMITQVPVSHNTCSSEFSAESVYQCWQQHFKDAPFIKVHPPKSDAELCEGKLSPCARNNSNYLDLFVFGHKTQSVLMARYDNLGKGASGAAVQNMNLMLGLGEMTGLENAHAL